MSAGRLLAGITGLVVAVAAIVTLAFVLSGDDSRQDAERVYCLAPDQRQELVDAAVALDLADRAGGQLRVSGVAMDPVAWRADRPDDFERACAAIYRAAHTAEPSTFTALLPFLTGATSAILAFIAALSLASVTRGRERADRLRSAFEELRRAVEAYIDGLEKAGLRATVVECRGALVTQLAIIQSTQSGWHRVSATIEELTVGRFDAAVKRRPPDGDELTARLTTVRNAVFAIAHVLEKPLLPHRRTRLVKSARP